ncbi:hypothetical protein B0H13DRAFT_2367698 [Mycena leptocephala]|nr:hypothetical protein B0H13DRAFT_2367698 [Mycena leptocephala]
MVPRFTSVTTIYVVRPLLPAPCPVTLPVLLTNIIPEQFPLLQMLLNIDPSCTPTPPPDLPHRAPTPAPHHDPTPAPRHDPTPAPRCAHTPATPSRNVTPNSRESSLTPMEGSDSDSDSDSSPATVTKILWPSSANIQAVKLLFLDHYPHLTPQEQDKKYTDFRSRLDELCTQYLHPSVVLSYQDKDEFSKVYNKMTAKFPWLAHYDNYWPASVCLQGKLRNSAAHATEKSTREVLNIIAGTAPSFLRELRCRHYSTSHNTPRFAFTPTHIEYSNPDAPRYPLVESIFSDAAHQPWIFMKRGKALNANACANTIAGDVMIIRVAAHDTTSVVNMRSTDSRIADYIFHAALQRMTKFQSAHRTHLPKELTVHRAHAFPGSP